MIRTAQTENGILRGLPSSDARITTYKGVPFAKPPVGENRWKAPQRCEDWEGIRDAYTYGPIPIQDTPGLGTDVYCREWHVDSDIPMSEDCLYLNIWTPAKSPDEKLPVLVWIYGGAFQWGYTAEMEFEGDRLARRGVIVVTVGYRLGVLGFMAHPDITKESPEAPANFGLLDQRAGIEWVIRNIAAFGGDPEKITVGGQSAGGSSVMAQVVCNRDLSNIKGAAIISGLIKPPYWKDEFFSPKKLDKAEKLGIAFLDFLGCKSVEEARKLDSIYIRDKYAEYAGSNMNIRMSPCVDGKFLTDETMWLLANNKGVDVPLFSGNTGDEFINGIAADNDEELKEKVQEIFGEFAEDFYKFPENTQKTDVGYSPLGVIEPSVKAVMELRKQNGSKADNFYYRFIPDIPGDDNLGTFHSVDLWFYFETLAKSPRPFVGHHYDLARQMCNYFAEFIKKGNPNGLDADGSAMPEWLPYTSDNKNEMNFTAEGAKTSVADDKRIEFFTEYTKSKIVK